MSETVTVILKLLESKYRQKNNKCVELWDKNCKILTIQLSFLLLSDDSIKALKELKVALRSTRENHL